MVTNKTPEKLLRDMTDEGLARRVQEQIQADIDQYVCVARVPIGSDGLVEACVIYGSYDGDDVWRALPSPETWKKITAEEAYALYCHLNRTGKVLYKVRFEEEGDMGKFSFENILQAAMDSRKESLVRDVHYIKANIRAEEKRKQAAVIRAAETARKVEEKERLLLSKLMVKWGITPDLIPENAPQEVKDLMEKVKKAEAAKKQGDGQDD